MSDTGGSETVVSLPSELELIDDAAVLFDASGTLLDWNPSFADRIGVTDGKAEPVTTAELLSEDARNRLNRGLERALETGSATVAVPIPATEDTEIDFSLTRLSAAQSQPSSRVIGIGRVRTEPSGRPGIEKREEAFARAYDIIADSERPLEGKIDDLLAHVRGTLGTDFATLSRVDGDEYVFEAFDGPEEVDIEPGESVPLEWTNCERVVTSEEKLVLDDIGRQAPELANRTGNIEYGISSYLGAPVVTDDEVYGTFCFYGTDGSAEEFSEWEVTFVNFLSKWVSNEIERQQLFEELRREERERYEALVNQSNDGVMVVQDARYEFVNERFAEITGYGREKLLEMHYEDVVAPEYHDLVRERYERRLAGESPPDTYELEIETAGGERRTLEMSVSPLPRTDETAVLANVRDVTRRKRRERGIRALQEATERIQKAETAEAVAAVAVEAATEVVGTPYAGCWLHDPDAERLEVAAVSDALESRDPTAVLSKDRYEYGIFLDGEATRYTPKDVVEDASFETGILLPLGRHGMIAAGHPDSTDTDEMLIEVARTLAEHTTTALGRVERAEKLRASKRRLRAIFDHTFQFTGLLEPDGTLIEANDTVLEFGDLDREAVLGKKLWETYWFDDREDLQTQVRTAVERAAAGEFIRDEMVIRGAGRDATVDFSLRPVTDEDGTVTLLIPEGRDITELKERERELRRERDHIRRTERLADVGGLVIDPGSGGINLTDGARGLFDAEEGFEPTLSAFFDHIHATDRGTVRESIADCRTAGTAFDLEIRIVTATGRIRWVRLEGERVTEDGGPRIRCVVRDVTDRREREQRLMVLNRVLRHNLRNQLTVVGGYADQLSAYFDELDPTDRTGPPSDGGAAAERTVTDPIARAKRQAKAIKDSSDELLSLAEKVRAFEKAIDRVEITGGVEIRPVLSSLVDEHRNRYPDAEIALDIEDVAVRGNEKLVRLAVRELLENAIVHNEGRRPEVAIRSSAKSDEQVAISVADDGPGIPEMEREVLRNGEESPLLHGSGIGLWTVNWLITRMGGHVSIDGNDPSGTVVTVTVPGHGA